MGYFDNLGIADAFDSIGQGLQSYAKLKQQKLDDEKLKKNREQLAEMFAPNVYAGAAFGGSDEGLDAGGEGSMQPHDPSFAADPLNLPEYGALQPMDPTANPLYMTRESVNTMKAAPKPLSEEDLLRGYVYAAKNDVGKEGRDSLDALAKIFESRENRTALNDRYSSGLAAKKSLAEAGWESRDAAREDGQAHTLDLQKLRAKMAKEVEAQRQNRTNANASRARTVSQAVANITDPGKLDALEEELAQQMAEHAQNEPQRDNYDGYDPIAKIGYTQNHGAWKKTEQELLNAIYALRTRRALLGSRRPANPRAPASAPAPAPRMNTQGQATRNQAPARNRDPLGLF